MIVKSTFSCINAPLFGGDQSKLTIEVICFPSLHVHMGIVNKLYKELELVWPDIVFWADSLSLVREAYFDKTFEVFFL
jgi:hypothetical protein